MTVAEISKRAKQIRVKSPSKKWTDCIKQASKELKAGKGTSKVGATKKSYTTYAPDTRKNRLYVDMSNTFGKITDTTIKLINSTKQLHKDSGGVYYYVASKGKDYGYVRYKKVYQQKTKGTKSSPVKQTKSRRITGSHTDTKSHNVRINVLSGMQGAEIPVTLNGVKTLTKGAFYLYTPENGKNIFKYIGKSDTVAFPLIMDSYTKNSKGSYIFNGRFVYSSSMLKSLKKIKTPTAKELSIGHLKLLK